MHLCYYLEIFKTKQNEYALGKQLYKSPCVHTDVTCSAQPLPSSHRPEFDLYYLREMFSVSGKIQLDKLEWKQSRKQ